MVSLSVDIGREKSYDYLMKCFFVSDQHGDINKYNKLFYSINKEKPDAVFIGGDILPHFLLPDSGLDSVHEDFINDFLVKKFDSLKERLGDSYPRIFLILGNDDGRFEEPAILDAATRGVWHYCHLRRFSLGEYRVYGYAYVPPTPFRLKDWERYDVSRYVDPGCIAIEEGVFSHPVSESEKMYTTISEDLKKLTGDDPMDKVIFLFHSPPYQTKLDRAALDGKKINHAPLDIHVGSIAIKRFIEDRQPLITLHGHIHESTRITGAWQEKLGRTYAFSAAHEGKELALVVFDPRYPEKACRQLL
ncbi:MAG: metallophosphoesterase [Candidatus Aminicenantes bacterium]|nr:metallophosphoesterase [Candidatus Aminicenantes bacterium]